MTIERDFKLFREQLPAFINAAVESRIQFHLAGLRSQLTQLIEAKLSPAPLPDPRVDAIIARIDALATQLETTLAADPTARIDALEERLRRHLELDRYTATRALIIDVLRSEDLLKESSP